MTGWMGAWRGTVAGLCATLVGIGLARFAYTPLLPALIDAGWFAASPAAYLGAANLAGYLAGALFAPGAAARLPTAALLRGMMLLAAASFAACAFPLSFGWYFVWRFLAGAAGGALMALAAPAVLAHVSPARRGLAGGVIFTGVGLGIAASGTLVPLFLRAGLAEAWLGLGALALALTVLAWGGWPRGAAGPLRPARPSAPRLGLRAGALLAEYALIAVGLVPHMVFLVDFVARGLGQGLAAGAAYWVVFGLGAMAGPVAAGITADRTGFGPALRAAFLLQALGALAPAVTASPLVLGLSALVIGAFVPGVVVLVLGRIGELVPPTGRQRAWSWATTAFALGQAAAAYGFSFLFAAGAGYPTLFLLGAGAFVLGLAIDLGAALLTPSPRGSVPAAR